MTTNVTFGAPTTPLLFITESDTGSHPTERLKGAHGTTWIQDFALFRPPIRRDKVEFGMRIALDGQRQLAILLDLDKQGVQFAAHCSINRTIISNPPSSFQVAPCSFYTLERLGLIERGNERGGDRRDRSTKSASTQSPS